MRWLESITLTQWTCKLCEIAKDRIAWHASVRGVTCDLATEQQQPREFGKQNNVAKKAKLRDKIKLKLSPLQQHKLYDYWMIILE